jgi:hypothetical protein
MTYRVSFEILLLRVRVVLESRLMQVDGWLHGVCTFGALVFGRSVQGS